MLNRHQLVFEVSMRRSSVVNVNAGGVDLTKARRAGVGVNFRCIFKDSKLARRKLGVPGPFPPPSRRCNGGDWRKLEFEVVAPESLLESWHSICSNLPLMVE